MGVDSGTLGTSTCTVVSLELVILGRTSLSDFDSEWRGMDGSDCQNVDCFDACIGRSGFLAGREPRTPRGRASWEALAFAF